MVWVAYLKVKVNFLKMTLKVALQIPEVLPTFPNKMTLIIYYDVNYLLLLSKVSNTQW